jgi:hypothetical protein
MARSDSSGSIGRTDKETKMPELRLLRALNEQLRAKNEALEAKVTELTGHCIAWRNHHDYMVKLRADVERLCPPRD